MDVEEKIELIKRNAVEIITEDELREVLAKKAKPVTYCGYEPSGPVHLGHFVTLMKLMDMQKAGFKVKILLADVHALLNKKGEESEIKEDVEIWRKIVKRMKIKAETVLGSSFQYYNIQYVRDVMAMAQETTINRGLRSMQEVARDTENAAISQALYPLMQIEDIKALGVDVTCSGIEQRKIHMLGRELAGVTKHKFVCVHTPLITSLKGPGQKMSKSIPGSFVSLLDSDEQIKKTISAAYCPEKSTEENPILQIAWLIIFPRVESFEIKRQEKFGGTASFGSYAELEAAYVGGKVHPLDLKNAVSENLIEIIAPIRKKAE